MEDDTPRTVIAVLSGKTPSPALTRTVTPLALPVKLCAGYVTTGSALETADDAALIAEDAVWLSVTLWPEALPLSASAAGETAGEDAASVS
ncbi:MAG: hypothetical protein MR671_06990 [Clostridiales bacterium]|nr:hypothetical protein [Clostridiales bacterium]